MVHFKTSLILVTGTSSFCSSISIKCVDDIVGILISSLVVYFSVVSVNNMACMPVLLDMNISFAVAYFDLVIGILVLCVATATCPFKRGSTSIIH